MSESAQHMSSVDARRAIEALRSGVPNRDAVRALGCMQPHALDAFAVMLEELAAPIGDHGFPIVPGQLVSGDFGSGKSHLLGFLAMESLDRRFVSSTVVISKETPLYDPVKVVDAALREGKIPGATGSAVGELAQRIDYAAPEAEPLVRWAATVPDFFAATIHLHRHLKDPDLLEKIVAFWSGGKLGVSEVRAGLRQVDASKAFTVTRLSQVELALLRLQLCSYLARANGYNGLVVLLDEVELIGRYSLEKRGRSYAELSRWLGLPGADAIAGVTCVATITDDYEIVVLNERNDQVLIGERLRTKGGDANLVLAARAEAAMRLITRGHLLLLQPTVDTLRESHDRLRRVYEQAYGWPPPPLLAERTSTTRKMRSYVRRWINEWDLLRIYPGVTVTLEEDVVRSSYEEDVSLEQESEVSDTE